MAKKQNFEDALNRLEAIARELEQGDISLDDTLQKFEEGMKLAEFCDRKLEDAQKRIDILMKKDGELVAVPFEDETGAE